MPSNDPVLLDKQNIRSYYSRPSDAIMNHQAQNRSKFSLITDSISLARHGMQDSITDPLMKLVVQVNNLSKLSYVTHTSHPDIHAGYFDEITPDGVIYVRNALTGRSIRKDNAMLTTAGEYIATPESSSTTDKNFINLTTNEDNNRKLLCLRMLGNPRFSLKGYVTPGTEETQVNEFWSTTRYIYLSKLKLFHKVTKEDLTPAIHIQGLQRIMSGCARSFFLTEPDLGYDPQEDLFEDGLGMTNERLKQFFDKGVFGNSHYYGIGNVVQQVDFYVKPKSISAINGDIIPLPKDNPYLPGFIIDCENGGEGRGSDFVLNGSQEERITLQINMEGDSFISGVGFCSAADRTVYWRNHVCLQARGVATDFPVQIAIAIRAKQYITTNKTTLNNKGQILGYSTRVPDYKVPFLMTKEEEEYFKINKNVTKPIFLGIELEYVMKKPTNKDLDKEKFCALTVKEIADSPFGNHCLMKSDSSIRDTGFELVTIPATLAFHKKMFDEHFFKPKFADRVMGSPNCGLHVHIGKSAFVPPSPKGSKLKFDGTFKIRMGKFIAFMNSPDNLPFLYLLGGREQNIYCIANPIKSKDKYGLNRGVTSANKMNSRQPFMGFDRRSIVNTNNAETIEIRLFKSHNDRNTLFRRLEFCHALVEFVKIASPKELTIYHFLNFLLEKENAKAYPCLLRWLSIKGYVGFTKKRSKKTGKVTRTYGPCKLANPLEAIEKNLKAQREAKLQAAIKASNISL